MAVAVAMVAPEVWSALAVVALTAIILHHLITKVLWDGLWVPLRYRRIMSKQGVKSVPFRFLVGQFPEQKRFQESLGDVVPVDSFADFSPTVVPQYALFFPKFPGEKYFLYWVGSSTRLVVRDPEIARELFISNYTSMRWSPSKNWFSYLLLGKGISMQVGEKWSTERRVLHPFFHQNSLKGMVETISEVLEVEIRKWEETVSQAGGAAEIDISPDVHATAGRVLSATAFGGDFETGDAVSKTQKELAMELFGTVQDLRFTLIPYYWKFPTARNRRIKELVSKIDLLLIGLINRRLEEGKRLSSYGNDLLGTMLESAADDWDENSTEFNLASVFNNCKLLYFAGQDTAANATLFAMLMLALHPEWQERARNEILEVVGDEENLAANVLSQLKVVGMCVNETLRAFTISPSISRLVTKDLQLKDLFIPKGMVIEFASTVLHQDKQCWGDDAAKWNPERFANGVAAACSPPQAFVAFGLGPRMCIGNNFALMEIKIALCKVLRRFELVPSPNYKHYPIFAIVARPKYGLPIILKALRHKANA